MNSLVKDAHGIDAKKAGERVGLKSDQIIINGGNPLRGRIAVRGAKNLATKAMVAALLGETPSELRDHVVRPVLRSRLPAVCDDELHSLFAHQVATNRALPGLLSP